MRKKPVRAMVFHSSDVLYFSHVDREFDPTPAGPTTSHIGPSVGGGMSRNGFSQDRRGFSRLFPSSTISHLQKFWLLIRRRPDIPLTRLRTSVAATAAIFVCLLFLSQAFGQTPVLTQHYDNARTGQNTNETILTPANVNPAQFGKLFTQPLDGVDAGQPLYVPQVYIPGLFSIHNVVYVATLHDGVYAFDADNNQGTNASPLWYVSLIDPPNGVTSVPQSDEGCSVGYTEFGIQGTPVIDLNQNAIYLLAMTKENGAYVHRLHALDLGTGAELFGGPVTISASVTVDNQLYTFIDKYQQQRPGLLLQDGIIYIGFGSPGCNIPTENGWVMAYNETSLQQVGVFNTSPGVDASAIWGSGGGLVGDGAGNIYATTGDGLFDANTGGPHYGDSVLELNQGNGELNLVSYFTPYDQRYFQLNNLDVGSSPALLLPGGAYVAAIDKNGALYLMNQNNLGGYDPLGDTQIPQELDVPIQPQGDSPSEVHAGLTYWNNNIYVAAFTTPVMAYSFSNGQVSWTPTSQTPSATSNPQGGIVSANGDVNAIYWYVSSPTSKLFAFDATNLANQFYNSAMAANSRDVLSQVPHFPMPIVADGHVYIDGGALAGNKSKTPAQVNQLMVYGLLPTLTAAGGNNQSGVEGTTLPVQLQAALQDPYSGNPIPTAGIPVTFAVSGKVGSFSNPNASTDSTGTAYTSYTLPSKPGTYTITASSPGYVSATFTVVATTTGPTSLSINSGNNQKAPVTSPLPLPLNVKVKDAAGIGLAGIQVSFSDGGVGGSFTSPVATTNSAGLATTSYTTGTQAGAVSITASVIGVTPVVFKETVEAGPAAVVNVYAGNNQTAKLGAVVPKELEVIVLDQYGNVVPKASVSFNDGGAGGSFAPNPAVTAVNGIAGAHYTAPMTAGPVTVTASVGSVYTSFTVNVN